MHAHTHACTHTCTGTHTVHTCTHTHTQTDRQTHKNTHACTHTCAQCTNVHTQTHTYKCTYTNTHTHTYTQILTVSPDIDDVLLTPNFGNGSLYIYGRAGCYNDNSHTLNLSAVVIYNTNLFQPTGVHRQMRQRANLCCLQEKTTISKTPTQLSRLLQWKNTNLPNDFISI